jgi:dihydrofolate reductase
VRRARSTPSSASPARSAPPCSRSSRSERSPPDPVFDAYNAERLRAADTLLLGRNSFDGFKSFWPPIADDPDEKWSDTQREVSRRDNEIEKVAVSDTLTREQTDPWEESTRIVKRDEAHEQIAELKQQSGKEILVFGSRTLWSDLLANGLVDELHLMIGARVKGGGTPMFEGEAPVSLELLETRMWDGSANVMVRYGVRKDDADS